MLKEETPGKSPGSLGILTIHCSAEYFTEPELDLLDVFVTECGEYFSSFRNIIIRAVMLSDFHTVVQRVYVKGIFPISKLQNIYQ